jgi:hypothetical protein
LEDGIGFLVLKRAQSVFASLVVGDLRGFYQWEELLQVLIKRILVLLLLHLVEYVLGIEGDEERGERVTF